MCDVEDNSSVLWAGYSHGPCPINLSHHGRVGNAANVYLAVGCLKWTCAAAIFVFSSQEDKKDEPEFVDARANINLERGWWGERLVQQEVSPAASVEELSTGGAFKSSFNSDTTDFQ